MHKILSPAVRSWLYGVVSAAIPILVILGVITGDQSEMWLQLAAAVLGLAGSGVAVVHRPTKTPPA